MNSLWIQKTLEFDEDMIQLTCPFCHDDKFFAHKDNERMPKYCPMCGARMDLTDASDAELVDMFQDVIKGKDECIDYLRTQLELTTEDKHYFVKEVLRKEEINTELAAAVKARDEQITSLKCQLEEAQEEINEADGYYCSMMDNLRDDIQDLKQQFALSDACCGDTIKKNKKLKEELFAKHNEYAQLRHEYDLLNALFEDMKKVIVTIRPHEWAKIAKKYNEED